jgi:ABC-type transporter lipoprotein component MlaA
MSEDKGLSSLQQLVEQNPEQSEEISNIFVITHIVGLLGFIVLASIIGIIFEICQYLFSS